MGRTVNTKCKICGKFFYKRPSHKEKYSDHHCSLKCRAKDQIKDKKRTCKKCGEIFEYKRTEQQFCSVRCAASRPRKERKNNNGKNRPQTLLNLLKEDGWNGKCMVNTCNYELLLDIHRIIHGKDGGQYTRNNIVAICPNHHAEIHRLNKKLIYKGELSYKV